jgi:hypothetical protein
LPTSTKYCKNGGSSKNETLIYVSPLNYSRPVMRMLSWIGNHSSLQGIIGFDVMTSDQG